MDSAEIYYELSLSYYELQHYLIKKYGAAKSDYFATPECKTKSKKIPRTSEGLFCHHMDEDKGVNLSNKVHALKQPFAWQRKDRLVYCNALEHLILHIKIAILRQKDSLKKPVDIIRFFSSGGINMVCELINDLFMTNGTSQSWRKRCYEEIKTNYDDYILLLQSLLKFIDNCYTGEKNTHSFLVPGSIFHFDDGEGEILQVSSDKKKIVMKLDTGEIKCFYSEIAFNQLTYADQFEYITRGISSGYANFYEKIFKDISAISNYKLITDNINALIIDYSVPKFEPYAKIKLTEDFGSDNAKKYISQALPIFGKASDYFHEKKPIFWKGDTIPRDAENNFFIVRIETMFTIKEGLTPFIRYRGKHMLRYGFPLDINENSNFLYGKCVTLSTSDIYHEGRYISKFLDYDGVEKDATVILTLAQEDYLLFKKTHNIRYLKILDGCYFI